MAKFKFTELVNSPMADIVSACLGTGSNEFGSDTDVGKVVKLGDAENYVLTDAGDDIEGFITSVEANTYNEGYSFGGVQKNKRFTATIDNTSSDVVAVGDLVVAGSQKAAGTAGGAVVRKGTPSMINWRVISLVEGDGTKDGDTVLVESV